MSSHADTVAVDDGDGREEAAPAREPAVFIPSADLPPGRILQAADVSRALARLRCAFGLPPPGSCAVRRVSPGVSVPLGEWPAWLLCRMPKGAVRVAQGEADAQRAEREEQRQIGLDDAFEHAVALSWLHRIVAFKVQIDDPAADAPLEQLVDRAAELLACTAGKAASGPEMTTFCFARDPQDVQVTIRDMTLVDDALGGRTWGAAPLLAAELMQRPRVPGNVLELGAGTGLVGLALAARAALEIRSTDLDGYPSVVLTDHHPTVLSNLKHNVSRWRKEHPDAHDSALVTRALDWYEVYAASTGLGGAHRDTKVTTTSRSVSSQTLPSTPQTALFSSHTPSTSATSPVSPSPPPEHVNDSHLAPGTFPTIIAADCVYDPVHPAWIQAVATTFLSKTQDARLHIISPLRETHRREIEALLATFPATAHPSAAGPSLFLIEAAVVYGQDDFGGASRAQRMHDQAGADRLYLRLEVAWSPTTARSAH